MSIDVFLYFFEVRDLKDMWDQVRLDRRDLSVGWGIIGIQMLREWRFHLVKSAGWVQGLARSSNAWSRSITDIGCCRKLGAKCFVSSSFFLSLAQIRWRTPQERPAVHKNV
jgi:hypothetical protein